MGNADRMTLTVLDDGTAKLEVGGISGANHVKAEDILKQFTKLMGGSYQDEKSKHAHRHHQHTTTQRHSR